MDEQVFSEKLRSFRGIAKIPLRHFDFERTLPGVRTIREEHIHALLRTFESEGCLRLNPANYVDVLIEDEDLQRSLAGGNLEEADLLDDGEPHFLPLSRGVKIAVLHGRHRLLAAERFPCEKWWTARLYSSGLPRHIQEVIEEEHPGARSFCDGDIYRNIRYHQSHGNIDSELKWRGRLSRNTARELKRMESNFRRLTRALDKLLPFVGLWKSLKLSYLGRWLSLQCPEELVHYFNRLHDQWSHIMTGRSSSLLDPETIDKLETLMPECSLHDAALIENMMEEGIIFPLLETEVDRQFVLRQILGVKGRILSFHTFTRDFIYFEACSTVLKGLLPAGFKRTVSMEFLQSYTGVNQLPDLCRIQLSDHVFEYQVGNLTINPNLGYRQLFLAVMRDFPVLSNLSPYRNTKKTKPTCHGSEFESSLRLARLAFDLGFETPRINDILGQARENPDEASARDLLKQLRPPYRYVINPENARTLASHIGANISTMAEARGRGEPRYTSNLEMQPKRFRCSRPSFKHYKKDQKYLFIKIMYHFNPVARAHITSLAVQRDIFVSFFGEGDLPAADVDEPPQSPAEVDRSTRVPESDRSILTDSQVVSSEAEGFIPPASQRVSLETEVAPDVPAGRYSASFVTASISTHTSIHTSPAPEELSPVVDIPGGATPVLHHLRSRRPPSEVLKSLMSARDAIIVYVWNRRAYARFSTDPDQKLAFEELVCQLADDRLQFILTRDSRVYVASLRHLWDAACRDRLVLVGPKHNRFESDDYQLLRRDPFSFIDMV